MFWYEFYLRGIGHAEQCYDRLEEILSVALEHLLTCDCEDGCPNCTSRLITPYHVRNIELGEGIVASRRAAVVVLNSLLTGQSVTESLALLDTPREKRGMRFLPTVIEERRPQEPHKMPLDERTRRLMARKLDRDRLSKLPVDHPIDFTPPVGIPPPEQEETLAAPDAEKRSGYRAIRRTGDPLVRGLYQKLKGRSAAPKESERIEDESAAEDVSPSQSAVQPSGHRVIQVGDTLARRARQLKRKREAEQE